MRSPTPTKPRSGTAMHQSVLGSHRPIGAMPWRVEGAEFLSCVAQETLGALRTSKPRTGKAPATQAAIRMHCQAIRIHFKLRPPNRGRPCTIHGCCCGRRGAGFHLWHAQAMFRARALRGVPPQAVARIEHAKRALPHVATHPARAASKLLRLVLLRPAHHRIRQAPQRGRAPCSDRVRVGAGPAPPRHPPQAFSTFLASHRVEYVAVVPLATPHPGGRAPAPRRPAWGTPQGPPQGTSRRCAARGPCARRTVGLACARKEETEVVGKPQSPWQTVERRPPRVRRCSMGDGGWGCRARDRHRGRPKPPTKLPRVTSPNVLDVAAVGPSAKITSKASEDLPEPLGPLTTHKLVTGHIQRELPQVVVSRTPHLNRLGGPHAKGRAFGRDGCATGAARGLTQEGCRGCGARRDLLRRTLRHDLPAAVPPPRAPTPRSDPRQRGTRGWCSTTKTPCPRAVRRRKAPTSTATSSK